MIRSSCRRVDTWPIIRAATQSSDNGTSSVSELDYITVKGFKSIASIEKLRPGALTVLIGPNGSGKSNFLSAFSLLHAILEGRLQEYVGRAGGAERVLHFGSRVTKRMEIEVSFQGGRTKYGINLQPNQLDELIPSIEDIEMFDDPDAGPVAISIDGGVDKEAGINPGVRVHTPEGAGAGIRGEMRRDERMEEELKYVRDLLARMRPYHFHDTGFHSPMKKTADVHDNRYLRFDGSNLASFLYLLREKHEGSYRSIVRTVRQVAPFFKDFALEPLLQNPDKIRLEWGHVGTDAYFDASSLSDGTLRFMAIATLFLQPVEYRPSVILLDEPELGMHPYAITLLASLMRQAAVDTQVIVSTQSSLLVDHFEPEDVVVADRVDGGTQFTRLESSKLAAWLEDYSLGQLWEKNELGGRPRRE